MIGVPYDNDWAIEALQTLGLPRHPPASELSYWQALHAHALGREVTSEEAAFFRRDLIRLRQDPRVAMIRVNQDSLVVKTARVVVDLSYTNGTPGRRFLGVWGIVVQAAQKSDGTPITRANLVPLETGHLNGGDPPYRYNHLELGFCFGAREVYIFDLLKGAAIADAVSFMLVGLWHVNRLSMPQVLSNFARTEEPLITEGGNP